MSIPETITLNCPQWCTTDHGKYLPDELWNGGIIHSTVIGKVPTSNSASTEKDATVSVTLLDSLDNGRGTPEVLLSGNDEMPPGTARKLAGLLVDASMVAELPVPAAPTIPWLDRPGNRCPSCGRNDRIAYCAAIDLADDDDIGDIFLCRSCNETWVEPAVTDPFKGVRYEKDSAGTWVLVQVGAQ